MDGTIDFERLRLLALKYVASDMTPAEEEELNTFLDMPGNRERFDEIISKEGYQMDVPFFEEASKREANSWATVDRELEKVRRPAKIVPIRRWGMVAAGVATLVLCYGVYEYKFKTSVKVDTTPLNVAKILPGGNRATLTLSSGFEIVLDSMEKGEVSEDAGSKIVKAESGQLTYKVIKDQKPKGERVIEISFNTLKTPKGGTYEVILPDHSEVVLNSASSLRYPTVFPPGEPREVELTGEAYFVVHADPSRPFKVSVRGKMVEALGTIFNVNAYQDEPSINATLLQGSVRVSDSTQSEMLRPGQQARIVDGRLLAVTPVDTETVVAWKNGDFRFIAGTPLEEVLRQLARWYNVDVQYVGEKPRQPFVGVMSRNLSAIEIFKALERSGYKLRFTESKIVVSQ
jgi:ferric-dicitrate binding protein FerR (iron transport regulator)